MYPCVLAILMYGSRAPVGVYFFHYEAVHSPKFWDKPYLAVNYYDDGAMTLLSHDENRTILARFV